jgi:3-keto-disaccharide hydrolase
MKIKTSTAGALLGAAAFAALSLPLSAQTPQKHGLGYQDTPIIPGTKWHVHDGERPQPKVVTPGEPSTQDKVGTAPSDAVVLFDGKDLSKWRDGKGAGDAKWKVENGEAVVGGGDIFTKDEFGPDVQLHVEWAAPTPPKGEGQGRGNSGVFLFGRYEMQVLDNYESQTYPDGQATAIYGYMPPLVNACRPPGKWQSYDIIFEGPRFNEDGTVAKKAIVTILHNGIVTQNHTELIGETPHKQVGTYHKHGEKGPLKLQDHGNPVRYRNIWIRELKPVDSQ